MQLSDRTLALAALGVIAVLAICIVIGIVLLAPQIDELSPQARVTPLPTFAVLDSPPRLDATETASAIAKQAQATMTVRAGGQSPSVSLIGPQADSKLWGIGKFSLSGSNGTRELVDGRYHYEIEATQSTTVYEVPKVSYPPNYTVWLRSRRVSGDDGALYGMTYRYQDPGNNYTLLMGNENFFRVNLNYQNKVTTLVGWSEIPSIHPNDWNKIAVSAEGSHFTVFINDQYIGEFDDDHLSNGRVGLAFNLPISGQRATCEFDQFEIHNP